MIDPRKGGLNDVLGELVGKLGRDIKGRWTYYLISIVVDYIKEDLTDLDHLIIQKLQT